MRQVFYYKVGQSLLQSGVGFIKWSNFVANWGNYYRKGQYTFVALGQMETYVYRQGQYGLRTEFLRLLIFGGLSAKQFTLKFVFKRLKFIRLKKAQQSFLGVQSKLVIKISDLFYYTYLVKRMLNIESLLLVNINKEVYT